MGFNGNQWNLMGFHIHDLYHIYIMGFSWDETHGIQTNQRKMSPTLGFQNDSWPIKIDRNWPDDWRFNQLWVYIMKSNQLKLIGIDQVCDRSKDGITCIYHVEINPSKIGRSTKLGGFRCEGSQATVPGHVLLWIFDYFNNDKAPLGRVGMGNYKIREY